MRSIGPTPKGLDFGGGAAPTAAVAATTTTATTTPNGEFKAPLAASVALSLDPIDVDESIFSPSTVSIKTACLSDMKMQSSTNGALQRRARLHSQVDQLVTVVLSLLKQLQEARKTNELDLADMLKNVHMTVLSARGTLSLMNKTDVMHAQLMDCVVATVRSTLHTHDGEPEKQQLARRSALEAVVELALLVRRLKDRSQEQATLASFVAELEGPGAASQHSRNDPEVIAAIQDCVSSATEFLLAPPQPLETQSFLDLGTALRDMHRFTIGDTPAGVPPPPWVSLGIQLLEARSNLLEVALEAEVFKKMEARIRQLMQDLSQALIAPVSPRPDGGGKSPTTMIRPESSPAQMASYLQGMEKPLWPLRVLRALNVSKLSPSNPAALFELQLVLHSMTDNQLKVWLLLTTLPSVTMEVWRACLGGSATPNDVAAVSHVAVHTKAALSVQPSSIHPSLRFDPKTRLLAQASVHWLLELMLKEEYRMLEPRIVEVVLMTHTVFMHSTEFLRLVLDFYDKHRVDENALQRTLAMDLIGYWFCSPLYLRPDHMTERFVGTWQEYVKSLIQDGTLRESEKASFSKFTGLLMSHYAKLKAQDAERAARAAKTAKVTNPVARGGPPTSWADMMHNRGPHSVTAAKLISMDLQLVCASITKVDWSLFAEIRPYELFGNAQMDATKAPCFAKMTRQFNQLNLFTAATILEFNGTGGRAEAIQFFINVAARLFELNNFHGSYAVLCGLNSSSVQRLARSWKKVSKKHTAKLEELMALNSHTKNYKEYRKHLRSCKPPMVPQLGIISRDLFGLEENNEDFLFINSEKCVNVAKARMLEKITGEMLAQQGEPYENLPPETLMQSLIEMFTSLPDYDEKILYARSLEVEPREETTPTETK